jgi:hypothetical protein
MIVAINAFLIGMAPPFVDHRPATFYSVIVRPWTRAGVRVIAVIQESGWRVRSLVRSGIALQIASYPA